METIPKYFPEKCPHLGLNRTMQYGNGKMKKMVKEYNARLNRTMQYGNGLKQYLLGAKRLV